VADLTAIVGAVGRLLGVELSPDGATAIARRGRGTPRVVNRLLRRVRDYAQINGDGRVDAATADKALPPRDRRRGAGRHGPQAAGRDRPEVRQRAGRRAGAGAVLAEEPETVEDVYEPFLLRLGFLDRTPQGRIATDGARPTWPSSATSPAAAPRRADQPALWDGTPGTAGGRRRRRGHRPSRTADGDRSEARRRIASRRPSSKSSSRRPRTARRAPASAG
jgi:hypothetical protein